MTPASSATWRTRCPTCHRRAVADRINHPAGAVLRCPLCGAVHALHRERHLSVV